MFYWKLLLTMVGCCCFCMLNVGLYVCYFPRVFLSLWSLLMRPWNCWKELSLVWADTLSCVTTSHRDLQFRLSREYLEEQKDDVKLESEEDIH